MPRLQVFANDQNQRRAHVYSHTNRSSNASKYTAEAGMDTYYLYDGAKLPHPPILCTSGASPCVIIVVHCSNGKGALGHRGGTHSGNDTILQAAIEMHDSLSDPKPLDCIILAGGGGLYALADYRNTILRQLRAQFRVDVRWPVPDSGDVDEAYTAATYLPTQHQLSLYGDFSPFHPLGSFRTVLKWKGYKQHGT